MTGHHWYVGDLPASERIDIEVDSHRRLRGPYTGLGNVIRSVALDAFQRWPELVDKYVIEILTVAPELRDTIPATRETLTSIAIPKERTRFYPANRTRRTSHGAVEFLMAYARLAASAPLTIAFRDVDEADHTDQEFLAIAARRARDGSVRFLVHTRGEQVSDELADALAEHAGRTVLPRPVRVHTGRSGAELARAFVESDGTSDDPVEIAAYQEIDHAERATLHDQRAAELAARNEPTLDIGAIPYHAEHGSRPGENGSQVLLDAALHCAMMGYYHSLLDYVPRGLAITDPDTQMTNYWQLATAMTTALVQLGRPDEAESIYFELRTRYASPFVHIFCHYALAMLYTRFLPEERRNHPLAKVYLNTSIALASQMPDPLERAFNMVFQQNGLALVETHMGHLAEALRLVSEGLTRLDRELPGDTHNLHRSVLVHNRARVYLGLKRFDEALADFDRVIELDPHYPDYYFDRADARRKLGDAEGALADLDTGIAIGAPFYELYYNRADLKADLGDFAGSQADLAYVVELEPDQLDARVNLVSLLLDTGEDVDAAGEYVEAGLRLHPGEARLLHLRGLIALARDERTSARADFDRALTADPGLVAALSSRATLAYELGDYPSALTDLSRALARDGENPDLWYNRGFVHQASGRRDEALRDYRHALELPGADRDELMTRLAELTPSMSG
ncbi:MAG TPA: tetratricopeptide repeat protein [Pseudonocardiaceae bacterium]|nr:tetratricopeptide repeat protein [Pseudonocardiaceae bacterium]